MQQELVDALKALVDKHWAEKNLPVMLSAVPKLLADSLPTYRTILGGKSIKSFIQETQQEAGYSLVEHPSLRAKVAVAPVGVGFAFSVDDTRKGDRTRHSPRETTLAFLAVLSELPCADQDKVVIPASVIAKLLK
jgi:hypothetical protein